MARNTRVFSDLDLGLTVHPVTHDISRKFDENAINQSLRNLILTRNYERPFHSEIGSQVRAVLFEPASPMTAIKLKRSIEDVVFNFEPRVVLLNVDVIDQIDNNAYTITITYRIVNTERPRQLDLVLERTR
jgi:phage baseplate assembly protein W